MDRKELYAKRPFKTRNADEYPLEDIISKFVSPIVGILNPFEYESAIVRGKKGTGKTMYLRANHAYYQFSFFSSISADCSANLFMRNILDKKG